MSTFELHEKLAADSYLIGTLELCQLRLVDDSQYPWFILVPQIAGTKEIYQLKDSQQRQLMTESSTLSQYLMKEFSGDKLNVAALGNVVSQLHVHHIVRFTSDPAWPAPIWGKLPTKPYPEIERDTLIAKVQFHLFP